MLQGIYEIRNKINGKRYIGRSKDIERRKIEHLTMLENGMHNSIKLQRAWNKYGDDSFEFNVVEEVKNKKMLHSKESKYIKQFDSMLNGYNMIAPEDIKQLTKKELKEIEQMLLDQSYLEFEKMFNLFDGKLKVYGNHYKLKLLNKEYNHKHYNSTCKFLNFAYKRYGIGDVSYELGYHFKRHEIEVNVKGKNNKIYIKKDAKKLKYIEYIIDLDEKTEYKNVFPYEYKSFERNAD